MKAVTLKGDEHIVIVRLSALGDVILLLPTVRALKAQYPQLKITWIISKIFYPLVADIDDINFIAIDKPKKLADYVQLHKQLKAYKFDILLALQASFRVNFIACLIKAKIKIGYDKARANDLQSWFTNRQVAPGRQHLLESFFAFANVLGVKQDKLSWDIPVPEEAEQWLQLHVDMAKRPLIVINPAASKPERNWVLSRYVELIQQLQQQYQAQIVLSGGPGKEEVELADNITQASKNVINLVGKTNLKQLAALLRAADCVIAPDTGPAHLAIAMGSRVVGLYAVCPVTKSGPYLSQQHCVDVYAQAVKQFLQKDVENVSWKTKVHHPDAMKLITVDAVLEKIKGVLDDVAAE
tara:strand:+ start:7692 stop:8750 length:1059 start_codon:yes stop_codon:yes gene_type:complete